MEETADEQSADQAAQLAGAILAELYLAPHGILSVPLARLAGSHAGISAGSSTVI
jgi:hypothetical protein